MSFLGFSELSVEKPQGGEETRSKEGRPETLEILGLKDKTPVILDTNLFYSGIYTYPNVVKAIPLCTYIELSNKKAQKSRDENSPEHFASLKNKLAWEVMSEILKDAVFVPTASFYCDAVLILTDRFLTQNMYVATMDKKLYRHLRDETFRDRALLITSDYREPCKSNYARLLYAVLSASVAKEIEDRMGRERQ